MVIEVKCKDDGRKLFEINGDMLEIMCPKDKKIIKVPIRILVQASTSKDSVLKV